MATGKGVEYKINFINNSTNAGSIMVFQQDQNIGVDGVMSLAWFSKFVHPNTEGYFDWTIDYNFVWAETGELKPGIKFKASQSPAADLTTSNSITLTHDQAYNFINQEAGSHGGSLYIKEDGSVPLKMASVGIGMSGSGTFAVNAQPNMNLTFTPSPQYWIAFGNYTKGEVLNIQEMTHAALVDFPSGVYTVNAILNANNSWTIQAAE